MKPFQLHTIILLFCLGFIFFWQNSGFTEYTGPILGVLAFVYVILSMSTKRTQRQMRQQTTGAFLLTVSTLLLLFSTGGFNSILYFLLYFIVFYISFNLEPEIVFVFCGALFFFFLPDILNNNTLVNFVKFSSLVFISPLAYFFGKEMQTREKSQALFSIREKKKEEAAGKIIKDVSEIVKNEGGNLDEKDIEKLRDIVIQSKKLNEKESLHEIKR